MYYRFLRFKHFFFSSFLNCVTLIFRPGSKRCISNMHLLSELLKKSTMQLFSYSYFQWLQRKQLKIFKNYCQLFLYPAEQHTKRGKKYKVHNPVNLEWNTPYAYERSEINILIVIINPAWLHYNFFTSTVALGQKRPCTVFKVLNCYKKSHKIHEYSWVLIECECMIP